MRGNELRESSSCRGIDGGFPAWDFMNDKRTLSVIIHDLMIGLPKPSEVISFDGPHELASIAARLPVLLASAMSSPW